MSLLFLLPAAVAGYLIGSVPSGVLLARLFGWPDPRAHGSGHTGALNVSRGAGWWALPLVMLADLLKGAFAVWLGSHLPLNPWGAVAAGLGAIVGHNWPVWLGFRGGMGLATAAGAVGLLSPLAVVVTAAILGGTILLLRHPPRAAVLTSVLMPLALWLLPTAPHVFWLATFGGLIIAVRHLSDWNREYARS